ncbi:MAG TPA: CBS domain-containing protein [Chitinophagaceae bacterium]|nr:CBS domain-containing protein [Chitinophagaceae bacterium]
MLTRDLHSPLLPFLHLHDRVYQALQLMNENHVGHLPIVEGEKFQGMISEDDLLQVDNDHLELNELRQSFSNNAVRDSDHFLRAVQVAVENGLSVVPVINEDNELVATLAYSDLLRQASSFMNLNEPGALIVLEVETRQYSFNEINRIIESQDAQITQLNTSTDPQTGLTQVTIKVNKMEVSDIVAAFQRYDYNVRYYFGEELYENELRTNYDNLMNYLKF